MATIRVQPAANGWQVRKGRAITSRHRKKSAAKRKASRLASSGDRLIIHRSNGTIQDQRRVR